jgi:MoaD family protein
MSPLPAPRPGRKGQGVAVRRDASEHPIHAEGGHRMKVNLKMLLPTLPEVIGQKELELEFGGKTVGDLIEYLVDQYGPRAKKALYDGMGKLDPVIQVLLNGETWIDHDQLDTVLNEGDSVILMMMIAGG